MRRRDDADGQRLRHDRPSHLAALLALLIAATPALAAVLPPEVAAFIARRDRCDHFRGEESDDPARQRTIQRALTANC